jgi:uncharacterized protein
MHHFIDRRLNPPNKSLSNRRRFISRVRKAAKHAVDESVRERSIADIDRGGAVSVPGDGISEPSFRKAHEGGQHSRVLIGNKQYQVGDRIQRPTGGGTEASTGSPEGEGDDAFVFALSRDEFLDLFFEDLELPDLAKRALGEAKLAKPERAGYAVVGNPATISIKRTMSRALGRRIALRRPKDQDVHELKQRAFALEALSEPTVDQHEELRRLHTEIDGALRRQKAIPYIDPLDIRYMHFVPRPQPTYNAVMFCLMDVSASMGEREKDLAKRFFVLLHLFLKRRYRTTELVFIRHTQSASEVGEDAFFNSRQTGGTVVSSALKKMKKIIAQRYPVSQWNIYAAQASDGENFGGDSPKCAELLDEELMPACQYFAYIEIVDSEEARFISSETSGMELWNAYRNVEGRWPNFAIKRIAQPSDIYPVFRKLFTKRAEKIG